MRLFFIKAQSYGTTTLVFYVLCKQGNDDAFARPPFIPLSHGALGPSEIAETERKGFWKNITEQGQGMADL